MRRKSKIIIDGEYMGDNVLINGMFRSICAISPIIMRYFIRIINNIKELKSAVSITNFDCSSDSINISFKNDTSLGNINLFFKMVNNIPKLSNYQIVVNDNKYDLCTKIEKESTNSEKTVEPEQAATNNTNNTISDTLQPSRNGEEWNNNVNIPQNCNEKVNNHIIDMPENYTSNPIKMNHPKTPNANQTKNIKISITPHPVKTQSQQKINAGKMQQTSNNVIVQNRLMTIEEFKSEQQKKIKAKEKYSKQKIRIIGSHEHINARALVDGVFVADNKVYKWGDTKVLE